METESVQPHFTRWILSLGSLLPIIVGIYLYATATGPGDQKMGAGMALAFVFFPISFLIGVVSAAITWRKRAMWHPVDRMIGFAPLVLYIAMILLCLCVGLWG